MRTFLDSIADQFAAINARSVELLKITSDSDLYRRPRELPKTFAMFTIGEYVLRSAATVEQTFGGLTTRLWDDPFEWTLPEKLNTIGLIAEYLADVEQTRERGLEFIRTDDDLKKQIPAPVEIRSIFTILLETISKAGHYQGRAFAIFQMLNDEKLPRL